MDSDKALRKAAERSTKASFELEGRMGSDDGREECPTCGKYTWMIIHSCSGIRRVFGGKREVVDPGPDD